MISSNTYEKLRKRSKVFGTTITHFNWNGIIPAFRKRNIDYVIIETEHNFFDWRDLEGLLRMCNMVELTAIVRVTDIVYHQISRVLDLGADGLLIPRIESLEQLERVIEFTRLPPKGKKGVGGYDFTRKPLQQKLAEYNEEKMIITQIESPLGIAQLDRMLETKEVAAVIVGPTDLSVSMGIPMQFKDPKFVEAVKEVIRICHQYKVSCGMNMGGKADMQYWCDQGMNVIWSGGDFGFFQSGYQQWCDVVESIEVPPFRD